VRALQPAAVGALVGEDERDVVIGQRPVGSRISDERQRLDVEVGEWRSRLAGRRNRQTGSDQLRLHPLREPVDAGGDPVGGAVSAPRQPGQRQELMGEVIAVIAVRAHQLGFDLRRQRDRRIVHSG